MRKTFFLIFGIVFLSFQTFPRGLHAEEKSLSEKEDALQRAVRFYRAEKYQEALAEFEKLETQDPKNLLFKHYIAHSHYLLRHWDQAILKLNEILNLKGEDLLLRGLLAEIYFKQGKFDKAAEQYQVILKSSPEEGMKEKARKRLEEIEELKKLFAAPPEGRMSIAEFMNSKPSQDFANEKFEEALLGFEELIRQYPDDHLLRRFRGMALTRLGRTDEAIATFQEVLEKEPYHVAIHFHLGQAYLAKGDAEKAKEQYQWVIAHDETDYRTRAQYALFKVFGIRTGKPRKPWTIKLTSGYEFDTNAILRSNDPAHRAAGDSNSSRYPLTVSGTYRVFQGKKWLFTADGFYTHTIYQDFPNLNLYTAGSGISALYQFSFLDKPSFLNFREGATITLLKNKLYVWSNTLSASLITNLKPWWRTTLSYRWSVNEFEPNGLDPDRRSRDGFVSHGSVSNNFYFSNKRNLYLVAGYDFERQDTSGSNNIRNAHGAQLGFHFPFPFRFFEKTEGEVHFRFRDINYNQFASTPPKRRDDIYTLTVTVTRHLTSYLDLTGSYIFEDARAKNNTYEYSRQIFSIKATASY